MSKISEQKAKDIAKKLEKREVRNEHCKIPMRVFLLQLLALAWTCDNHDALDVQTHSHSRKQQKRQEMNHDLAHCDAYDLAFFAGQPHELYCDKRDTCKRYKAYRNLKGDEEFPISFCSATECMKENYKLYWEDKE